MRGFLRKRIAGEPGEGAGCLEEEGVEGSFGGTLRGVRRQEATMMGGWSKVCLDVLEHRREALGGARSWQGDAGKCLDSFERGDR